MNFNNISDKIGSFDPIELAQAASKFLKDVMRLHPDEELVITVDDAGDFRLAQAFALQARIMGAIPVIISYGTQPAPQMEPPKPLGLAIQVADVWIELSVQYILYTSARRKATEAGCRYACLAGMNVDSVIRTIGKVDYPGVIALGDELVQLLNSSESVRVISDQGTDLVAQLDKNADQPGGIANQKGDMIMLGGQVGCLPIEKSIEGRIVVDGVIWPPDEIGILKSNETVSLIVKNGRIVEIEGGSSAEKYRNWLANFRDPDLYRMAHYVFGFNPGVTQLTGQIVEDERYFGSMTFGFGARADRIVSTHTDCIVLYPTVTLDGIEILKNGAFTHPKLWDKCKSLNAQGY